MQVSELDSENKFVPMPRPGAIGVSVPSSISEHSLCSCCRLQHVTLDVQHSLVGNLGHKRVISDAQHGPKASIKAQEFAMMAT